MSIERFISEFKAKLGYMVRDLVSKKKKVCLIIVNFLHWRDGSVVKSIERIYVSTHVAAHLYLRIILSSGL